MPKPVSLKDIKANPKLKDMSLVTSMRLSVQPVTREEWDEVCRMGGLKACSAPPKGMTLAPDRGRFIVANTEVMPVPLVPEVRLQLAHEALPIWRKTEEELEADGLPPPFWAFAWAGGQRLRAMFSTTPRPYRESGCSTSLQVRGWWVSPHASRVRDRCCAPTSIASPSTPSP